VRATGNMSESAGGYTTLYGALVGGFAPILAVPTRLVYELARHRNERGPAIPDRTLERPPSAELAPGQRDQDSLPPYELLDDVLRLYVEEARGADEIVAAGHDESLVREILRMVDAAEFKRHQAPPFVRISERSFTKDRRMPITNAWRH
jgi:NAD+ synthase (glutamine-hydrolysing)